MSGRRLIDPATNKLTAFALYRVYEYCCREAKGKRGYFAVLYGPLAYHVGLPYAFIGSNNAEVKRLLRDGLRRLARLDYIRYRPHDSNGVNVLLRVSYSKAKRNRRQRDMWRLFEWEPNKTGEG